MYTSNLHTQAPLTHARPVDQMKFVRIPVKRAAVSSFSAWKRAISWFSICRNVSYPCIGAIVVIVLQLSCLPIAPDKNEHEHIFFIGHVHRKHVKWPFRRGMIHARRHKYSVRLQSEREGPYMEAAQCESSDCAKADDFGHICDPVS